MGIYFPSRYKKRLELKIQRIIQVTPLNFNFKIFRTLLIKYTEIVNIKFNTVETRTFITGMEDT